MAEMKKVKKVAEMEKGVSKGLIFDLFYGVRTVSREGKGGKTKHKMTRILVSKDALDKMVDKIKKSDNVDFYMKYYQKERDRGPSKNGVMTPPPRPKN
jgi:uncharacterized protein YebE (UPF0316 family)